jgi:heme/copper-type cytochrome/quinol oxidase subunit 2
VKKRFVLITVFLFFALFDLAAQCAMCRASAETGNGAGKANGLNDAILYLMAIPYIILFALFFYFRKKIWAFLKEMRSLWS